MRPKVHLSAHDLKFQRQERAKLDQMRRQVLIPREKIPSLSSSNLPPSSFFHKRILHNKRVIIHLLFQPTKGHHISLSFPKRIYYSKTTPFGLEKGIYFFIFLFYPPSSSSFPIYTATIAPPVDTVAILLSAVAARQCLSDPCQRSLHRR